VWVVDSADARQARTAPVSTDSTAPLSRRSVARVSRDGTHISARPTHIVQQDPRGSQPTLVFVTNKAFLVVVAPMLRVLTTDRSNAGSRFPDDQPRTLCQGSSLQAIAQGVQFRLQNVTDLFGHFQKHLDG
jgi:hypothetical protein